MWSKLDVRSTKCVPNGAKMRQIYAAYSPGSVDGRNSSEAGDESVVFNFLANILQE